MTLQNLRLAHNEPYKPAPSDLQLKDEAISLVRNCLGNDPHIEALILDLNAYRQEVELHKRQGGLPPCPWFLKDLTWLPDELLHPSEPLLKRGDSSWTWQNTDDFASTGCELCERLCVVLKYMTQLGGVPLVEVDAFIDLHPVSLLPVQVRMWLRDIEEEWIRCHVVSFELNGMR
jgi:hypothetical protein